MTLDMEQPGGSRGTKHSLLVVSGPLHKTTSDQRPIPALSRFRGALFDTLRSMKRQQQLPDSLDVTIYTPVHGVMMSDALTARVDINAAHMSTKLMLEEFNRLLERYTRVAFVVTDDDWAFLRRAEGLTRSTLEVSHITGYQGAKLRKMREWIANL